MDLIERYLHAVKTHLPAGQQDDVVAELAEDLRPRIDDRQAELGRPLTEDAVAGADRRQGRAGHKALVSLVAVTARTVPDLFRDLRRIRRQTGAEAPTCRGSRIDATRTASMTSAAARISRPDV